MKKIGIILASVAGALVILLAILLLFSRGKKVESGDEESLYPYSYTQNKQDVVLKITGEFPKGYSWTVRSSSRVTVEQTKANKKEVRFTIRANGTGSEQLLFTLQKDGETGLSERLYEIYVDVYAVNNKVEVLSNYHKELTGISGGEEEGISYRIAPQEDGSFLLEVQDAAAANWMPQLDGTSVYVELEEVRQADGYYLLRVTGYELGQSTVRLCDRDHDKAVECFVSVDAYRRVDVVEHKIVAYHFEDGQE